MLDTKVPDVCCECGQVLSAATSLFGNHVPQPGDFTICSVCLRLNRFTTSMQLRTVDPDEFIALPHKIQNEILMAEKLLLKAMSITCKG